MHHYVPNVIAVRADSPWKTMKDFVEAARAKPESITIADPGALTVPHLMVMQLENAAGVKFASVHFGGGALSVAALLGGHVNAIGGATADALQHVRSGAWRVLGVAADKPADNMPEVPTMKAQGYDVLAASWSAIVAPAGTPQSVVHRLTTAMAKIIATPEHRKKLADLGVSPNYLDPAGFTAVWIDNEKRTKEIFELTGKK
jgi:tripartite-type tricarboxylate transporter receptor subunit TctC